MSSVASVGYTPVSPMPVPAETRTARSDTSAQGTKKSQAIQTTAADLQRISTAFNKKLQFVVDHNSNEVVVKVIDKDTDKVIRELPPEELQRLHKNLREAIGLLFDEMV